MAHVFISYAKKDTRALAARIAQRINAVDGYTAWMDESLVPGSFWADSLKEEINRADFMVVLLSPDVNRATQRRSFVLNEIDYAQGKQGKDKEVIIIPVMAQQTDMPIQLAGMQYIDLVADEEQGLDRLMHRLGIVAQPEEPPPGDSASASPANATNGLPPQKSQKSCTITVALSLLIGFVSMVAGIFAVFPEEARGRFLYEVGLINASPTPTVTETLTVTATGALADTATPDPIVTVTVTPSHTSSPAATAIDQPTIVFTATPTPGSVDIPDGMVLISRPGQPAFAIDITEVTRAQFFPFANNPANVSGDARERLLRVASEQNNLPMIRVTWHEARRYCQSRGDGYDLPSESQWITAAHWDASMSVMRDYPWGDNPAVVGNIDRNIGRVFPVGSFAPNAAGLYDMAGNAAEWVRSDSGVQTGGYRVMGGDYRSQVSEAHRDNPGRVYPQAEPDADELSRIGLRCVLSLP